MLTIKEFNNCANKSEFFASFEVISKNMLRFAQITKSAKGVANVSGLFKKYYPVWNLYYQ